MQKLQQKQAIRVTKTQTIDGYEVLKGSIGYVVQDATEGDTSVRVRFPALGDASIKISIDSIRPFTGDIEYLAARALGFDRLDKCLQSIQRKRHQADDDRGANRILQFRRQMHTTSMIELLEWTAEEATQDFDKGEALYKAARRGAYRP